MLLQGQKGLLGWHYSASCVVAHSFLLALQRICEGGVFGDNFGIMFSYFSLKHMFWVLIRRASLRRLSWLLSYQSIWLMPFILLKFVNFKMPQEFLLEQINVCFQTKHKKIDTWYQVVSHVWDVIHILMHLYKCILLNHEMRHCTSTITLSRLSFWSSLFRLSNWICPLSQQRVSRWQK